MNINAIFQDMKRKEILVYLLITFGVSWGVIFVVWLIGISPNDPISFFTGIFAAFSPAIAAIIVRKGITREGFADMRLKVKHHYWVYYLVALIFPFIIVVFIVFIAVSLAISEPDFTFQRYFATDLPNTGLPDDIIPRSFPILLFLTPILALLFTPILLGEEFGWRGYLQVKLLADRPLYAAIVTGVIWGIWHFPQTLLGYGFPDSRIIGLFILPVTTILLSIFYGWLQRKTDSIWAPSLAHAAHNSISGLILMLLFIGGPNWIFLSHFGILTWIPLGLICAWIILTSQLTLPGENRL